MGLMRAAYAIWNVWQIRFEEMMKRPDGPVTPRERYDSCADRFVSSYMLLAGYGIENAVKGLLVVREGHTAQPGELPKGIKSHDLSKLAYKAGITLNRGERILVDRLRDLVMWRGR